MKNIILGLIATVALSSFGAEEAAELAKASCATLSAASKEVFQKRWNALASGEGRAWMADGRYEKPPELTRARIMRGGRKVPAVHIGAFRSQAGELAWVLANGTDEEQPVRWVHKGVGRSHTVPPCGVELVRESDPIPQVDRDRAAFARAFPVVDLSRDRTLDHVVAAGTPDVYHGHPTSVTTADGRILTVWNIGHGGHAGPAAESADGGRTWTRIDSRFPAAYERFEDCPSIYRLVGPDGKARLWVWTQSKLRKGVPLAKQYARDVPATYMPSVMSEDEGRTWREMPPLGPRFTCVMAFSSIVRLADGSYMGFFHRGPDREDISPLVVLASVTRDGGFTWDEPRLIAQAKGKDLCEPFCFRSPDGRELCCLLRENRHLGNSMMVFSRDEGKTWSDPVPTPWALTGDRHTGVRLKDGRLLIAFRDTALDSPAGGFVAWVGPYARLRDGRSEGTFRIKLFHSHAGGDCGYPGVELLPDGRVMALTYVKYNDDSNRHSIVAKVFAVPDSPSSGGTLVDAVDTSIGAITLSGYGGHGLGKTFPGACVPFGMVQLSPDTITGGDNGPGYSHHHTTIEGFSFTHMSGIGWFGDLGNIQVQPGKGPMRYFHDEETTKAGLYEVTLREKANTNRAVCRVSATALEDYGVLRFAYAKDAPKTVTVDLARRIGEKWRAKKFSSQRLDFVSDREFTGVIRCDHRDGGWGNGHGGVDYTLHFRGLASEPLVDRVLTGGESNLVLSARFGGAERSVTLAVRISYKGIPAPFADGVPDFERTRQLARARWEEALGAIAIEGGSTRQRRTFATALYHAMIDPRQLDGAPLPKGHVLKRTVFSGWDVFRSEMPLLSLIRPEAVAETIEAMCETVRSGARTTLPRWDLFACPSGCMVGNPLIPVMLTADDCGIPFDRREALRLAVDTARRSGNDRKLHYYPGGLSQTLEYAYDDWCVARLAERVGDEALRREFDERAQWYRNVWDPSVGWMRTRLADGSWMPWKGETAFKQGTIESNPLQQGWFVPHDVEGLVALVGGREKFVAKLESFFRKAPDDFLWGDYYNHPNEPSHHIPFLFAKAGRPERASHWTRQILDRAYSDTVRGLCGNDDVGQMSAWYVLAAIGLNPMCPGSGEWILTAPLFPKATLRFPARGNRPASTLVIETRGEGTRIVRAELNGRPVTRPWLTTAEILTGGRLVVETAPDTFCPPPRWALSERDWGISWRVDGDRRLPHADRIEMSGRKASLIFDYGVSRERKLTLSRRLVWPGVRVQPNNTYGSMAFTFLPTNGIPRLTADGAVVDETVSRIGFDGVWTSVGAEPSGLRIERRVFPSATGAATFERWIVTNGGNKPLTLGVTSPGTSWIRLGCTARHVISATVAPSAPVVLESGRSAEWTLAFAIRPAGAPPPSYDGAAEESARRERVRALADAVRLETDDPMLDELFRLSKIRAGESIFDTAGGAFHCPGGGTYYAATWCNDQVEYAGPWFAVTGDALALEASMNAYRHYMPFMADDYAPIPSSVIAEGRDYWNGAGDRGDAAMWAYGASRFVLAAGRIDFARELRRGLRWTLEYCRRKLTADGVVASRTDELEGRLPAGKANLNTSVLYYDALLHAAMVERKLGDAALAADYEARAKALAAAIDRYFGAEIHGYRTYRYFDGCEILRAWIGIPLCAGLFGRADGTTEAILSPYLRTKDAGLLSAEGDSTGVTWDRSQLYAFRGIFAAGLADRVWGDFRSYTRARLLGEHVPYPVEAWPEGGRRHLAAESALYCRAVTEGLFGLEPDGFGSFRLNARLPKALKRMALRNVRTANRVFDVVVDATGTKVIDRRGRTDRKERTDER